MIQNEAVTSFVSAKSNTKPDIRCVQCAVSWYPFFQME